MQYEISCYKKRSQAMKKNMGIIDRVVRILFAVLILQLFRTGRVSGILAIILGIFTLFLIVTGFMSYCPLYNLFRMSTGEKIKSGDKK